MNLVAKKTGYFKSFDGTKIYYEVRGEGPPIVFAYGIGCLINHWQHQIDHFSKNYTTIAFDYRGHHRSETPSDTSALSVEALAKDIEHLLLHLEIKDACFMGHSFGVQVLLKTFELSPSIVNSFIFVNGFANNPMQGMFGNDLAEKVFQAVKNSFFTLPETSSTLFKLAVNNPIAIQMSTLLGGFNIHLTQLKDIEIYARGIAAMNLKTFIYLFENMMNFDGRPILPSIGVPTFIIGGKNDSVTPEDKQQLLHASIPGSEFLMIPHGSHCSQLDMPDLLNLNVEKFLAGFQYQ